MNFTELIVAILSSGTLSSVATYLVTFKSKRKQAELETEHQRLNLQEDQFTYLQKMCDKYMKEYYEMHDKWRQETEDLKLKLDNQYKEGATRITEQCNEIASLKSKLTYLQGISCYKTNCPYRIQQNPNHAYREVSESNQE